MCDDLGSLLAAVEAEPPDVVVTDIRMPPERHRRGHPGRRRGSARRIPGIGVVVLSQYAEPGYALALLEHGSEGRAYLLKERVDDVEQLVAAIRAVAEGGSVVDPKVVEALVAENARADVRRSTSSRRANATCCARWRRGRTTRPSRPRSSSPSDRSRR